MPIKHRWRRRQARIMCEGLHGRDRSQSPALIYARLRAMDALAFEKLLLESFERRGHRFVRNRRDDRGDGGIHGQVVIDGRVWLIQGKRYAGAIRPEHVQAFASLCTVSGLSGLFIHTGRIGSGSRDVVA
ncbi:restriction endonuclease [Sphingomonas sp. 2R-10]|uniref:restriction endonuclease n=1 Tax=Sphingomonas sp. 2R-10 TaxID=3045148 RepID=UPI0024B89AD9|nr:restriction endonuclease [Sphingomonas sp. 2R-10]MDJ0276267.1 restriction endonuclease [Sphingomonas sp. 2R-10]